jgi:hypothetical protein
MPATTTDVSAGMNSNDLKTPLNLSLPSFELISTASSSGMGMSSSSVKIMYFKLLPIARKNRRSLRSRSKFRSPTFTTCPGRMCWPLMIPDLMSGLTQKIARVSTKGSTKM